tara:strand:- start:317 stop:1321 length:1005 start_codon:yes stop_codon:yes gene_type:complete
MKTIYTFFLLIATNSLFAQNTIRFAQINFAQGVNNPASLAYDGKMMADLIIKNQWFGVDGAPTTVAFNAQYEIESDMAVGLNFFHDRIGAETTNSFAGQYAYRISLDFSRSIAFGIGLGLDNNAVNFMSAETTVGDDPAFANQSYSRVFFNGSFGVFYNAPKFYIGASIPKLVQSNIDEEEGSFRPKLWHYYMSTGLYLSGKKYTFNPHLQIKAAMNAPLAADLILRNTFVNRFSVVVGYRTENSIIAGVDFLISQYARVGYSFSYDVGKLSKVKGVSNELYIGVALPYNSDRSNFGQRKFIDKKGTSKRGYRKRSNQRQQNRGQRYGRTKKGH